MSSARPNLPRIDTEYSDSPSQEFRFSLDATSPFTPPSTQDPEIPSFRLSTSPNAQEENIKITKPAAPNRERDERRKLLAYVLLQLRSRTMPPSISDVVGTFHEVTKHGWSFKDAVKAQVGKLNRGQLGGEDEDDEDHGYSTDATFDLMLQLQELLALSLQNRWDIFDDSGLLHNPVSSSDSDNKPSPSPFRRSRSSFHNSGRKSRSPSPNKKNQVPSSDLLTHCISVLASVVAEDCRFQITSPRPSCPPNALQVLTLNVAQLLLLINAHEPRIVSQIGLAIVPAFSSFNKEMYPKIISFFDQGIIRNSLSRLGRLQGVETNQSVIEDSVSHPLVSIHVDEVAEEKLQDKNNPFWIPWTSTGKILKVQSTNAPSQPLPVYYLSSVVPPLLGVALDNIELEPLDEKDSQTIQFLRRLLHTIVDLKVDSYLDLLQVVAYHTPKARKFAASLLSSIWPRSVGHVLISQPPKSVFSVQSLPLDHEHQFVPWYFRHRHNWFSPGDSSQYDCHACRKALHGFGLLCPYCACTVHFDCYDNPSGSALVEYTNGADPHVRRVAMFRFSRVYPDTLHLNDTTVPSALPHQFHRVSLFTLSPCSLCQQPLWGCSMQAFYCSFCSLFVHPHCVNDMMVKPCGSSITNSSTLTVSYSSLRQSCMEQYHDILSLTRQSLARKSYEEVSIFRDLLLTQLQILNQGLMLGTLLILHKGQILDHKQRGGKEFELHHTIKWCEELLGSDGLYASPALEEFLQENGFLRRDHSMLYTWSTLVYVAASMKSPSIALGPSNSASSDFLNVTQLDLHADSEAEEVSHPFDTVSLAHMRDVLGHEFRIYSDAAAFSLLSHLHQIAFFVSKDESTFSDLSALQKNKNEPCSFPLPLGLDLSIDVETLVSAIEACLSDIDLYVNEFGFLLLIRRMWPDGLMSDYGLRRLARGVFAWIINEDSQLAIILRDYLGKNKPLPGMASNFTNQWPPVHYERPLHGGSGQNGGDYLASRQILLHRYARRWLLALHNQDVELYAGSMFDVCDELADHTAEMIMHSGSSHTAAERSRFIQCERVLHHILRLSQAHVVFSASDTIYLRWLELAHSFGILEKDPSFNTLLKLFPRDSDYRTTTVIRSTSGEYLDRSVGLEADPWQIIVNTTQVSQPNVERGLRWLNLLSRSGIEVPLEIWRHFLSALGAVGTPLKEASLLIKAMLASLWLRSLGREQYQQLLANLQLSMISEVQKALEDTLARATALSLIKSTFASCLLLYGCERTQLLATGFVEEQMISTLPSRRRLMKEAVSVEPVFIDPEIMKSIDLHLKMKIDDVTTLIAQFIHTCFTSSVLMEAYEVDNFILKNGQLLSNCAWKFYDVQKPEIIKLRTPILLRVLSVDPERFQDLLAQVFSRGQEWEKRAASATRLFRVVQDVCSPGFVVEGRQWKSSIVKVFQSFFSLLWLDSKEEIRLVVKSHCCSLLPAHFEAMTSCFDETITRAPFADRIKLVSFLTQLRVHFPRWQVLSWNAILEAFAENSEWDYHLFSDSGAMGIDGLIAESDPELARLNVSLVALALDMLSDGVEADCLTLIKIKAQLVRIFGFQNVAIVPAGANGRAFHLAYGEIRSVTEFAYPCFGRIVSLLDSWYKVDLPSPALAAISHDDEKEVEVLIGTIYADIPLNLLATYDDILQLPVLVIKQLLEAVHVIVYKHDFENRNLSVFSKLRRAIARALDLLEVDVPHEVRQLSFSIVQAFFRKATNPSISFILNVAERILKLHPALMDQLSQDSLAEQGCFFVGDILEKYCKSGLFISLLKVCRNEDDFLLLWAMESQLMNTQRPLTRDIFFALKHILNFPRDPGSTLRDDLLYDTLMRLQEIEFSSFQDLLNNLLGFVEVIHHDHYTADSMALFGKQLIQLAQRMSDGSGSSVDASPLLSIPTILVQHNRSTAKDLLPLLDNLFRVVLIRLQVSSKSVAQFLVATNGLRRKSQVQDPPSANNTIIPTIFDILNDGLRLKTRLQSNTLQSVLEALVSAELTPGVTPVTLYSQSFVGLAEGGFYWLDHYFWVEGQTEQDFHASLAVAKMIFQVMSYDALVLKRHTENVERNGRSQLRTLRAWNILAITALSNRDDTHWATQLFEQLKIFSATYLKVLWPYIKPGASVSESATADINQAYLAIKLWYLIARQTEDSRRGGKLAYEAVWNELWPPFEGIVNVLEAEAQNGVSPIMAGFIASSITDLFLFIRTLRIPFSLQGSAQKVILRRLQSLVRGESVLAKINRAIQGLTEVTPEIALEILIDQAAKDIVATEKLKLLEMKREPARSAGDRRANIEKKTTVDRLNWKDVRLHT